MHTLNNVFILIHFYFKYLQSMLSVLQKILINSTKICNLSSFFVHSPKICPILESIITNSLMWSQCQYCPNMVSMHYPILDTNAHCAECYETIQISAILYKSLQWCPQYHEWLALSMAPAHFLIDLIEFATEMVTCLCTLQPLSLLLEIFGIF